MEKQNDVVIGGIAGRFPESENLMEFWKNLINGIDMVTEITDRWNADSFPMPSRMGHLKGLDKFDANFIGINGKQAENMDPRLRFVLELTHEAIIDAGINPITLRGTNAGVFVGACGEEYLHNIQNLTENPSGYCATGAAASMLANRISFAYDFKGPSISLDTACSSSLLAFQLAFVAVQAGSCDSAIVGGVNTCLEPKTSVMFHNLGTLSIDGKCKSFDAGGQGYARSEAAVVLYVCKSQSAKRTYATIVHAKTNSDGFKSEGLAFPSGALQEQLLRSVYAEAGVDPKNVDYVEAHGTGTRVGDPQEANAIARVFCEGRDPQKPLLLGAVKSNMGHGEPAAGLCQIAKVILINQHGIIPGNLHYSKPNPDIPSLLDGRISVVDRNTKFSGTLVGINSFGFGGVNVHALLKLPPRLEEINHKFMTEIPLIVPFSGRTSEVQYSLETLMNTRNGPLMAILQDIAKTDIPGHNYRSYGMFDNENDFAIKVELQRGEKRPIWFLFSGLGSQYTGMVKDMMKLPPFRQSIQKSTEILKSERYDLEGTLFSQDSTIFEDALNGMVAITTIQVALTDLLSDLGILPNGIFGHSLGEIACAYADGCLTAEQTLLMSLARAQAFKTGNVPGAMASIGLSWDEASKRCPQNVYPACNNAADNVTISGPKDLITQFISELKKEGIFAEKVKSADLACHSRYMKLTEPYMRESFTRIIPNPFKRTSKWISTSVPVDFKNSDLEKYCSVDYFVNNALSPVRFYEALMLAPKNAFVIEIAPHNFTRGIVARSVPSSTISIGLMNRKTSSNVRYFLDSLGQVYLNGYNPNFTVLYHHDVAISSVLPMISPVIKWDHSESWFVKSSESVRKSFLEVLKIRIKRVKLTAAY